MGHFQNLLSLDLGALENSSSFLFGFFDCLRPQTAHLIVKARHSIFNLAHLFERRLPSETTARQPFLNRTRTGFKELAQGLTQIPPQTAKEASKTPPYHV